MHGCCRSANANIGKHLGAAYHNFADVLKYIECMASAQFLSDSERNWLEAVSPLSYANPFLPERIQMERAVLGDEFVEGEPVWSYRMGNPDSRVNIARIMARLDPVLEQLQRRLRSGAAASERDLQLYEDAA